MFDFKWSFYSLRHRRRLTTQTIRKRQPTGTYQRVQPVKKSGNGGKFFKFMAYLILLAAIGYAGYVYVWPLIDFSDLFSIENQPVQEQATLPVEERRTNRSEELAEQDLQLTPIKKKIQLEILNGCGEQGIAKILGDRLIRYDYDIVNSGNYIETGKTNFNVEATRIVDQLNTTDNLIKSKELAALIGLKTEMIESFENPAPIADITIIVGKDFKSLPVFKKD